MSENIIYCYSGAGHCLDMAKTIAKKLGDTDIVMMRSYPVKTDAREAKRVGFVFSCMAGGLPGDMEKYIRDYESTQDMAYKQMAMDEHRHASTLIGKARTMLTDSESAKCLGMYEERLNEISRILS